VIRTTQLPEANESLWLLVASPVIWAAHFLLCYGTAAVWCAKVAGYAARHSNSYLHGAGTLRSQRHRLDWLPQA
jgi:hypothetical protein